MVKNSCLVECFESVLLRTLRYDHKGCEILTVYHDGNTENYNMFRTSHPFVGKKQTNVRTGPRQL